MTTRTARHSRLPRRKHCIATRPTGGQCNDRGGRAGATAPTTRAAHHYHRRSPTAPTGAGKPDKAATTANLTGMQKPFDASFVSGRHGGKPQRHPRRPSHIWWWSSGRRSSGTLLASQRSRRRSSPLLPLLLVPPLQPTSWSPGRPTHRPSTIKSAPAMVSERSHEGKHSQGLSVSARPMG